MRTTLRAAFIIVLFLQFVPLSGYTYPCEREVEGPGKGESIDSRVNGRSYPSLFQAWDGEIINLQGESEFQLLARHDLTWQMPFVYGLAWNRDSYVGLATGFTKDSIGTARDNRGTLLALNPNMVLLASIYYRDMPDDWLPENSEFWLRDANGDRILGFEGEGGYKAYLLDFANPAFQSHVASRCRAAVKSKVVDGIMLDWWNDDDAARMALLRKVRKAIGKKALIVINTNQFIREQSAPYVNGYFMECPSAETAEDWGTFIETLSWAEENLRSPTVNCFLILAENHENESNRMRACYALALTQSNGYAIYSLAGTNNWIPHHHEWYPVFDDTLGKAKKAGKRYSDGSYRRLFKGGWVIYNPIGNASVVFKSKARYENLFTGKTSKRHVIRPLDGAILVRKAKKK